MQSMTGYGKETSRQGDWEMTVELRAVNHRFLDLSMRLGRGLTFLEETIRKTLAPLCRGHVDVQLTLRRISGSDSDVTVDATLAAAYMQAANTLQAATGAVNDLTVSRLMQLDGVTIVTECALDEEALTAQCREVTALAGRFAGASGCGCGAAGADCVACPAGGGGIPAAPDRTAGASAD
mgnify:CR=1 FL=1